MGEPTDMIVPLLREMRDENRREFSEIKAHLDKHTIRLDRIDERQKSFSHALAGDSLMGKMVTGDFEQRIEALEARVKELEASR